MNSITRFGLSVVLVMFAAGLALGPVAAEPLTNPAPSGTMHFKGVVLEPDGMPAADATVTVDEVDYKTQARVSAKSDPVSATGAFDILAPYDYKQHLYPIAYVRSPTGFAMLPFNRRQTDLADLTVTLSSVTKVRLHFQDDHNKPIANLAVRPNLFFHATGGDRIWDVQWLDLWGAVTDDSGTATFVDLPQGCRMRLDMSASAYADLDLNQDVSLANAPTTPDVTLHASLAGSIAGTITFGDSHGPASGIHVIAMPIDNSANRQRAITDSSGHYRIDRLLPGGYNVWLNSFDGSGANGAAGDYTAVQQTAGVSAGEAVTGVDMKLIHGATISGTVTDIKAGKPISSALIDVTGPAGQQSIQTDMNGAYSLQVPPGSQQVFLYPAPGMTETPDQSVTVADGETKTVDFKTTAPLMPIVVRGTVIGPDGRPVTGASVIATSQQQTEQDVQETTDAHGNFTLGDSGVLVTPEMKIYASSGRFATPTGTLATGDKPITLQLTNIRRLVIEGTVCDPRGKPIAGASVILFRQSQNNQDGREAGTTTTDSSGRYKVSPIIPTDVNSPGSYMVMAQAKGFTNKFSTEFKVAVGKPVAAQRLILIPTDSFVAGTVVDPSGNPIAGANVSLEGVSDVHMITDKQGRFHLNGAPSGKAAISVQAPGDRFASIMITSGRDDNVITAKSQNEIMAESKRFVAVRDADKTNHGDGESADLLLKTACQSAKARGKKVFLVFHASWCGPCFMLHRFLNDPQIKQIIDAHFVVQDIDIWENAPQKAWENPGGTDLYKKYGGIKRDGSSQGVPFFVILDPSQKKLADARDNGDNVGFPGAANADFFLKTLKAVAPTMTHAELAAIKAGLVRDEKF